MTTEKTIQAFFEKFGAGDRDGMLELLAENVDLDVPGAPTVPWTGRRDRAAAPGFVRSATEDVRTRRFDVEKIVIDDRDGIVLGEFTHEVLSTGKLFDSRFALRITVTDGLITRYHMFENSYAAALAFTLD